jgi:4-amino-4-deoxy-L-arabinose transferase-like glycosyltransferase
VIAQANLTKAATYANCQKRFLMSMTVRQTIGRVESVFTELEKNTRLQLLVLGVITLIGAVLRFYKLGEWSFWIEEIHTLGHASDLDALDLGTLFNLRIPFYAVERTVMEFLGWNEWTARLVPALLGVISLPLIFVAVRKVFNLQVAVLSAILLAIAPWHIYWSQNARFYTLLLLLFGLSLIAFYWWVERDQFKYFIVFSLALALAALTHPYAVVLLPICIFYFLLLKLPHFAKPSGLRTRNLLIISVLPLLGYSFYEAYRIISGSDPLVLDIYRLFFDESTASFIGYTSPYVMLTSVVYYIGTPLTFLTIPGSINLVREKNRLGLLLIIGAYLPLGTMMLLTLVASTANRYVFMALPCWIILAAVGVRELFVQVRKHRIAYLWLLVIILPLSRDPVIEDVIFFSKKEGQFGLFIGFTILVYLLVSFWLTRVDSIAIRKSALVWSASVVFIILAHPVVMDFLYYAYQHGHRDNWKAASAVIRQEKFEGDMVVSSIPPLPAYYLPDEETVGVKKFMNENSNDAKRAWYVQQDFADDLLGSTVREWVGSSCSLTATFDHFVAGRNWPMRVHLCHPTA